jgi:dolichyl-phosphate beta-glucosyltransferase
MRLSVIIPAYNEESRIYRTLKSVNEYLSKQPYEYEIIVVNDGSKDKTADIVRDAQKEIQNLRLIDNSENRGKGAAVNQGIMSARGKIRLFMDADNSTTIDHIERMFPEFDAGYDVVVGSRRVRGAKIAVHQNIIRESLGRIFNLIVRIITDLPQKDTQAGFKAFSEKASIEIFPRQTVWRWAFDVELLVIARNLGFKIKEIPITWVNDPKTHVKLSGMINMLIEVIKIRLNEIKGRYK